MHPSVLAAATRAALDTRMIDAVRALHSPAIALHRAPTSRHRDLLRLARDERETTITPDVMSDPLDQPVIDRRLLFAADTMRIGEVRVRPRSAHIGGIERERMHVLALPLSGVFARHDGPRRHVLATPNHAVFLPADVPYRLSFPGCIGDLCLTLVFPPDALAHLMPDATARDAIDTSRFDDHALLAPDVMLAARLLHAQLTDGDGDEADPLLVQEAGIGLLDSVLRAARRQHARRRTTGPLDPRARLRQVERVQEAITLAPQQRWSLDALAGIACVSPSHLAHTFRRVVGTSVYQYVLRARLASALERVVGSDADLTGVALDTGFSSHSHFTSRFREFFGVTPLALRCGGRGGVDAAAGLRRHAPIGRGGSGDVWRAQGAA